MTDGDRGPIIFGIDRAAPGSSDKSMMVEMGKLPHGQWKIVSIGEIIESEVASCASHRPDRDRETHGRRESGHR